MVGLRENIILVFRKDIPAAVTVCRVVLLKSELESQSQGEGIGFCPIGVGNILQIRLNHEVLVDSGCYRTVRSSFRRSGRPGVHR